MTSFSLTYDVLCDAAEVDHVRVLDELRREPGSGLLWAGEAPEGLLRIVVAALARTPPENHAGPWAFADVLDAGSPDAVLREALWEGARLRARRPVVLLPWMSATFVELALGDDFTRCVFVGGAYEPHEIAIARSLAAKGSVAVDVGANRGLFTLVLSRAVGSSGRVLAVEASEREVRALAENVIGNDLGNVKISLTAISDVSGRLMLRESDAAHPGTSAIAAAGTVREPGRRLQQVEATTLDDLVRAEQRPVSFVKLDVEGSEFRALQGAAEVLGKLRPALLFEANSPALEAQGATWGALADLLAAHAYEARFLDCATGMLRRSPTGGDSVVALPRERLYPELSARMEA